MADKFTVLFQGDSITDCGRLTCGGAGYNLAPVYNRPYQYKSWRNEFASYPRA